MADDRPPVLRLRREAHEIVKLYAADHSVLYADALDAIVRGYHSGNHEGLEGGNQAVSGGNQPAPVASTPAQVPAPPVGNHGNHEKPKPKRSTSENTRPAIAMSVTPTREGKSRYVDISSLPKNYGPDAELDDNGNRIKPKKAPFHTLDFKGATDSTLDSTLDSTRPGPPGPQDPGDLSPEESRAIVESLAAPPRDLPELRAAAERVDDSGFTMPPPASKFVPNEPVNSGVESPTDEQLADEELRAFGPPLGELEPAAEPDESDPRYVP